MSAFWDADVIVVGAGLTGLRAALEVSRAGLSVLLFERADRLGGRVSTQIREGFKLDYGFQVLLTAYPEVKGIDDITALRKRSFSSGARVRCDGTFFELYDPLRHPGEIFCNLRSRLASPLDLLRLLKLSRFSPTTCSHSGIETRRGLEQDGFSPAFCDRFLKPFLRGVLLDPNLYCDYGIARFYLQMFARGEAALPEAGMQAIPEALAKRIGPSHIRLGSAVNSLTAHDVTLEDGDSYSARAVVCAVDSLSAAQLGSPEQTMHHASSATLYFASTTPPFPEPIVVVSAEEGPITTLAVVSNVQPSYAPPGRSLIAITAIGAYASIPTPTLAAAILSQAEQWYGERAKEWRLLASVSIPLSVVTRPRMLGGFIEQNGIFYAGDYLNYPSQNGALEAGRRVGEALIERLS